MKRVCHSISLSLFYDIIVKVIYFIIDIMVGLFSLFQKHYIHYIVNI